jgi:hypothetical protein
MLVSSLTKRTQFQAQGLGRQPLRRSVILLLILASWAGFAPAQDPREYQVRAVMLLNLTRFVEWPTSAFPSADAPIVIGILGRDPFGHVLDDVIKGEKVNGRGIVLERFPNLKALRSCHMLYISKSERGRIEKILGAVNGRSILTVSEVENFSGSLGGMVRLYVDEQRKVRLRVNLEAAKSENLRLSSKLLQVAEVVRR